MNILIGTIFCLLGVSLIGTVLQNKIKIWENSQNMLFGCIGGFIACFFGLSVIFIVIVMFISILLSYIIFKFFISIEIFQIKSKNILNFTLILAVIMVLIGCLIMSGININNPMDMILPIFLTISGVFGMSRFINFVQEYDPDKFKDGETVYIVKSFFDKEKLSTMNYRNKKINIVDMNYIIGKKYEIEFVKNRYIININDINYCIKEKNDKLLTVRDSVKISKDNLNKGIINENDIIIVEKS